LLFENVTPLTLIYLQDAIKVLLVNYEPRVRLIEVSVSDDLDNNGFNVRLEYDILNRQQRVISTLFLERIR
jgi:phage baseplate assembly protein W